MPVDRFARQRQVREVGASGQERLERLCVVVQRGEPGNLEALYLERAGVQVERCELAACGGFPFQHEFEHDGPREVARAAHAALVALREGLGLTSPVPRRKALLS